MEASSRAKFLSLALGAWSLGGHAAGIPEIQRVFVRDLFFQARPLQAGRPCYVWGKAPSAADRPRVETDGEGAFVEIALPYRRSSLACSFDAKGSPDVRDEAFADGSGVISVKARPPLTAIPVANGSQREELLFETHLEALKDLRVLGFLERTLIHAETSWFRLSSNDSGIGQPWVATWPVVEAGIEFPFPLWNFLETGLSLTQSLGRAGEQGFKMSAFNLRLSAPLLGRYFATPYSWSVGAYYQGLNFFQKDLEDPDFRLSALRSVGGWSRASWSPGLRGGEGSFSWRRFGLAGEGGYSLSGSGASRISEINWEGALTHRSGRSWGLALGYERRDQVSARENEDGTNLREGGGRIFLRLQLLPYLNAKGTP